MGAQIRKLAQMTSEMGIVTALLYVFPFLENFLYKEKEREAKGKKKTLHHFMNEIRGSLILSVSE